MQLSEALDQIAENRLLAGWIRAFSRRPDQVNGPHEADSELVPLPGGDLLLALTVDTVAEEIALGFYRDAETIGWMAATVSLSDLAAVGAEPLGLLISVTLPQTDPADFQAGVARGVEAACRAAGTYVLGGDTNSGAQPSVASVAAGVVARERVLRRTGCRPGDLLYTTGRLGAGGPVAARALFTVPEGFSSGDFRPRARVREAGALAGFATACMDSSDGLIVTLDQLLRLNGVGFELTTPVPELLDPDALRLSHALGVDPLLMLAQPHGEFELLFTVPAAERERFERHATKHGLGLLRIGQVIPEPVIRLGGPSPRVVDGARIRNLLQDVGGDLGRYREELIRLVEQS
jgi:thiamine-monophosphate kinase